MQGEENEKTQVLGAMFINTRKRIHKGSNLGHVRDDKQQMMTKQEGCQNLLCHICCKSYYTEGTKDGAEVYVPR